MADGNLEYIQDTQTLIGSRKRELIDVQTGEQIFVDQITKRVYGSKNFWKCYLMDFLTVLGIIDSKQLDVFIFIVENTNQGNNTFIGTYDHISKEVGVCRQTIARIMKKLPSPSNRAERITPKTGFMKPKTATLETGFSFSRIPQREYATAETAAR